MGNPLAALNGVCGGFRLGGNPSHLNAPSFSIRLFRRRRRRQLDALPRSTLVCKRLQYLIHHTWLSIRPRSSSASTGTRLDSTDVDAEADCLRSSAIAASGAWSGFSAGEAWCFDRIAETESQAGDHCGWPFPLLTPSAAALGRPRRFFHERRLRSLNPPRAANIALSGGGVQHRGTADWRRWRPSINLPIRQHE